MNCARGNSTRTPPTPPTHPYTPLEVRGLQVGVRCLHPQLELNELWPLLTYLLTRQAIWHQCCPLLSPCNFRGTSHRPAGASLSTSHVLSRMRSTACVVLALVCAPACAFAPARALSPARSVHAPPRQPARAATAAVRMASDDAVDPLDRAFAAAVYLFPITDGIFFGKFLFRDVPLLGALCFPIVQAAAALG